MTKENYRQVIVGMLAVVLCYTFGFSFLGSLTILLCYALCYALRRRLSGKTYKNWRGDYCKPVFFLDVVYALVGGIVVLLLLYLGYE